MSNTAHITKEALAERYATLRLQADNIKRQMEDVSAQLISLMKPGDKIPTPEYLVTCNPGRASFFWTEAGKPYKKEFEKTLIDQGYGDIRLGTPYVQVRFTKQADED